MAGIRRVANPLVICWAEWQSATRQQLHWQLLLLLFILLLEDPVSRFLGLGFLLFLGQGLLPLLLGNVPAGLDARARIDPIEPRLNGQHPSPSRSQHTSTAGNLLIGPTPAHSQERTQGNAVLSATMLTRKSNDIPLMSAMEYLPFPAPTR
jgi:hypothetical protein